MLSLELTCGCLLPFQTHATDPRHLPSSPARLKHLSSIQRLPFVGHVSSSLPPWSLQVFRTVSSVAKPLQTALFITSCVPATGTHSSRHLDESPSTSRLLTISTQPGVINSHHLIFQHTL
ncbi:hypothetical protein QR685DRAFT_576197 [Neurospora intermedia]|uniref:Uncharacterized protein n=1 Tax=Neurospora intermedia TaxID=5142 RepID=A0ABR3CY33_NEUIN